MRWMGQWVRRAIDGVDEAIGSLENRGTVLVAIVEENRRAEKLVQGELERVSDRLVAARLEIEKACADTAQWVEKARQVGRTDRPQAIRFLHRAKACESRTQELHERAAQIDRRRQALQHQGEQLAHRTHALEEQHRSLRSRARTAETYAEISRAEGHKDRAQRVIEGWQSQLERLEVRALEHVVVETEIGEDITIATMEEDALSQELDALLEEQYDA